MIRRFRVSREFGEHDLRSLAARCAGIDPGTMPARAQESLVVQEGNRVVGFLAFDHLGDDLHVVALAVDPEYHGHGLGPALLHGLEREALRRGRGGLVLELPPGSDAARLCQGRSYRAETLADGRQRLRWHPRRAFQPLA